MKITNKSIGAIIVKSNGLKPITLSHNGSIEFGSEAEFRKYLPHFLKLGNMVEIDKSPSKLVEKKIEALAKQVEKKIEAKVEEVKVVEIKVEEVKPEVEKPTIKRSVKQG